MIEFKQIIGRGTRLYDGKDYFTIYDFVKAHHHFSDPEWDGEPLEPEPTGAANPMGPAEPKAPPEVREPGADYTPRQRVKVKLADGKAAADPDTSDYQLTVINTQQTQESAVLPFEVWDDRIIWCFNTAILSEETSPIEMNCDDYYQFKLVTTADCTADATA